MPEKRFIYYLRTDTKNRYYIAGCELLEETIEGYRVAGGTMSGMNIHKMNVSTGTSSAMYYTSIDDLIRLEIEYRQIDIAEISKTKRRLEGQIAGIKELKR